MKGHKTKNKDNNNKTPLRSEHSNETWISMIKVNIIDTKCIMYYAL